MHSHFPMHRKIRSRCRQYFTNASVSFKNSRLKSIVKSTKSVGPLNRGFRCGIDCEMSRMKCIREELTKPHKTELLTRRCCMRSFASTPSPAPSSINAINSLISFPLSCPKNTQFQTQKSSTIIFKLFRLFVEFRFSRFDGFPQVASCN